MEKEGEEKEMRVEAMMEYSSEYYTFCNNMLQFLRIKARLISCPFKTNSSEDKKNEQNIPPSPHQIRCYNFVNTAYRCVCV